jgi:hypothetical protein
MSNDTNTTTIVLDRDAAHVKPLVQTIRDAVNGRGKYAAYVAAMSVTRENVKLHAAALAVAAYPNDAPVQKKDGTRTRYGNAVQAAGAGLRAALGKVDGDTTATDYLAKIVKAVESALEHEIDGDTIKAALDSLI